MGNLKLTTRDPDEMARFLADGIRALRLGESWTRKTLAERSGVSAASLKRFENTGQASLALVLKVAGALGRLDEFEALFRPARARSLSELEQQAASRSRKRGRE